MKINENQCYPVKINEIEVVWFVMFCNVFKRVAVLLRTVVLLLQRHSAQRLLVVV